MTHNNNILSKKDSSAKPADPHPYPRPVKSYQPRGFAKKTISNSSSGSHTQQQQQSSHQRTCHIPRTVMLRTLLVGSLLTAASVCAAVAYTALKNAEINTAVQTYTSVALSATLNAKAIVERKFQATEVTAALASWTNPNADDWPMIFINGYVNITSQMAALVKSSTHATVVFLDPAQVESFETHIQKVYATEGRPNTTGYSDFGFGVWKPDPTKTFADGRAHDTTGEVSKMIQISFGSCHCSHSFGTNIHRSVLQNTWGGQDERLAVVALHNVVDSITILYNLYSEEDRGIHIDSMNACAKAHTKTTTSPACAVFTDMLELKIRPGPAAMLFQPIFPANDPTKFVGFATASLHWEEALTDVVPDYVNGLTCVVSTKSASFTYEIRSGGVVELIGDGDLHDKRFEEHAESVVLNEIVTQANTSAVYTLTVYPTATMFRTFSTKSPIAVAMAFLGVIFLCTVLFFLYDFMMRHEAEQRKLILDVKRRFVRFISHEIRTPLNTVCVGLELLERELRKDTSKGGEAKDKAGFGPTVEDIDFLHTVTKDVQENATVAVSILNDLLNYDKLETKTLELETEEVNPWVLIDQTVHQFHLQAIDRDIDLKLMFQKPEISNLPQSIVGSRQSSRTQKSPLDLKDVESNNLCVIGDEVRLSQVLRNIISNAFKFTPQEGTICITVTHVLDGLPAAEDMALRGKVVEAIRRSGSLVIRITDSGIGLTKEQLEVLFGEGVQFDANKLQHGGGSGLGLHIAKGIVDLHHGTIEAQSTGHGEGTSFVIELPLYTISANDNEQLGMELPRKIGSSDDEPIKVTETKQRRILVVEDALSSRKMLIRLLERDGHSCVAASNGRDAVEMIEYDMDRSRRKVSPRQVGDDNSTPLHEKFDTILMDYEMPFMNGPDAIRAIRALGYTGSIIGVTGNVLVEDVDYFKACGADEVLAKPISFEKLREYWDQHP
jgi:signal transduction histidine kinase